MKIAIQTDEGRNISLALPTGLVLNPLTSLFLPASLRKSGLDISQEQCARFIRELNDFRREHRDWVLVEVESASGEYVQIRL